MRTYVTGNKAYKLLLTVSFLSLLSLKQVNAETYFVSPSGSDSDSGLSISTPFKTIRNATNKAWGKGDIIYVMTGTYIEKVSIWQSDITLSAYPDNIPIIDGQSTLPNKDWSALMTVGGNNNIISGFEVKNSNISGKYLGGYGIEVLGHHNTISKMNVHHTWEQGIFAHGDYTIVEDSTIWQAALQNSYENNRSSGWGSGLSAARNNSSSALKPGINSYTLFRRNTVYNNWGEGISCFEADHCTLEDNIIYDNWTVNLYLSDSTNSVVQGNMIYISSAMAMPTRNNSRLGILLADEVTTVPRSANNEIINNFIYNADFNAFSWSGVSNSGLNNVLIANNTIVDGNLSTGSIEDGIVNTNSQIKNNIIAGKSSYIPNKTGLTFSNNNWSVTPPLAESQSDTVGNPQIARTGETTPGRLSPAYFKVLENSPVINAAAVLTKIKKDFFKGNRDTTPDIGAHEFQTDSTDTVDTTLPTAPPELMAYPNTTTSVDLTWKPSTDNINVAGYIIYRNGVEIGGSTAAYFTDSTITENTTFNYIVDAYDDEGNLSEASNIATVNIPQAMVAIFISSYSITNRTTNSVTISWTTNIPSTGVVAYGSSSRNRSSQVMDNNLTTKHTIEITGLNPRSHYYYQISAFNETSNGLSKVTHFKTR